MVKKIFLLYLVVKIVEQMRNCLILFLIFSLASTISSCRNPQKGALSVEARAELDELADAIIAPEQKYFSFAARIAQLLEESAAIPTEEAAMDHLLEFASENEYAISRLYGELNEWQRHMDEEERALFIMQLMSQPFTKQLKALGPRFRNRINYNSEWVNAYDKLMANLEWRR